MPNHYYIDGYNVLHRSRALKAAASASLEAARDSMVDLVAAFCASSQNPCTLVFDGKGERAERQTSQRGVERFEVVYAARAQTADSWIERAVYKDADRRDAVVVSGDRGITDLCMGMGSLAMTPDAFLAAVEEQSQRVRDQVERTSSTRSMGNIEDTLDSGARERMHALRQRLERGRKRK